MAAPFPNPFQGLLWKGEEFPETDQAIIASRHEKLEKALERIFDRDYALQDAIKLVAELRNVPFKGISLLGRQIHIKQSDYLTLILNELKKSQKAGHETMAIFDDREMSAPSPVKTAPSRIGKTKIGVHVEADAHDTLKELSKELGVTSDYLMHAALFYLFRENGVAIPKSIEERMSDPRARRPGRVPGRPTGYKLAFGDR